MHHKNALGISTFRAPLKLAVMGLATLLAGCAKQYVLVEYAETPARVATLYEAEVQSAARPARHTTLALSLPAACASALSVELGCRSWFAALRGALQEQGYRVVAENIAPGGVSEVTARARALGAGAVVLVAGANTSLVAQRRIQERYFASNSQGSKFQSVEPTAALRTATRSALQQRSGTQRDQVLGNLTTTLLDAHSERSLGSFRGERLLPVRDYVNARLLLRGRDEYLRVVTPEGDAVKVQHIGVAQNLWEIEARVQRELAVAAVGRFVEDAE